VVWHGDPDEAVGALAVAMLASNNPTWNRHAWGDAHNGLGHPLATFGPNALSIHLGAPLSGAAVWRTDGATVTAPDGQSWDRDTFCGFHGLGWKPDQHHNLPRLLQPSTTYATAAPLTRGILLALDGASPSTSVFSLCRFLAKQAYSVKGRRLSPTVLDKSCNQVAELADLALSNTLVRGDRAYAPSRLVVLDALFAPEDGQARVWRDAGFEAAQVALRSGVAPWFLSGQTEGASAHTVLLAVQTVEAVRAVFARHLNPEPKAAP